MKTTKVAPDSQGEPVKDPGILRVARQAAQGEIAHLPRCRVCGMPNPDGGMCPACAMFEESAMWTPWEEEP
ncbi:MAG: hypothetical protein QN194_15905 [Armatimonadota bacterium]|nr:hypothetical protein [Armatimonadota bacterium]